jgi:hypothetical protein
VPGRRPLGRTGGVEGVVAEKDVAVVWIAGAAAPGPLGRVREKGEHVAAPAERGAGVGQQRQGRLEGRAALGERNERERGNRRGEGSLVQVLKQT